MKEYFLSSLEPNWDYSTMPYTLGEKYRLIWLITKDKNIADMVWNNIKDYDGARHDESECKK